MSTPKAMDEKAIEAALYQWFCVPRKDMYNFDTRMEAAIAAYLEVSGVAPPHRVRREK